MKWPSKKRDADLERELRADLELEEEEQRERGVPADEARFAARRAFGNPTVIWEQTREAWGWGWVERLGQDVRYGIRQLIRNPGFTVVAVVTLALSIGVNTTIFSAVSAILLRKPAFKDPDTLCAISSRNLIQGYDLEGVSAPDFESWRQQNDVFEKMAAVETGRSFTLTGEAQPESVHGDRVTPDFFAVIGVVPVIGRGFLPSESHAGNDHVVILSDSLWRERFGGYRNAIDTNLDIDEVPYKIVGVMPPVGDLSGNNSPPPKLWMPLVFSAQDLSAPARGNHYINLVLGRLKAGVSISQARTEMDAIAGRLAQQYATTNKDWGVTTLTLQEHNIRGENVRNAMMLLMAAVGLVLLVACANVAGLLLTRGASRAHELAVRSALGASRGRILRQMLTESLLISTASAAAGLLISFWGIRLLRAGFDFNDFGRRMAGGFRIDQPTLLFMLAVTLATTVLFGLLPAIRSSKAAPRGALSQSGRTFSGGPGSSRLRRALVAGEVATAVILLTATGVFVREVVRELSTPNGFNPNHLLIATLDVKNARYKEPGARLALFTQVVEKARNLPEVEDADVDSCVPMGCQYGLSFDIEERPWPPLSARPSADFYVVGPDYFRTMQIPVLRGRGISADDNGKSPIVAVVNEEFARRFFPNEDAVGKRIEVRDGNHRQAEIVGVVENVNNFVGQTHPHLQIYESCLQIPFNAFSSMALVVRSRAPGAALVPILRRAIRSVDPTQPAEMRTMKDLLNDNFGGDELMVELMGLFGALALALAGLGIYGVIAYSVTQRTPEIGIRVALGAKRRDVLGLVLREGGVLCGIGCVFGAGVALLLPRLIGGLLTIAPQGPEVVFVAAVAVSLVSCLATYIPAHRAMNVDPTRALRNQ